MRVHNVIQAKGAEVVTIAPDADIAELVTMLKRHHIGAVVVSTDGRKVLGIVSERDVVRSLAEHGVSLLVQPVSVIMTASVTTCSLDDHLTELAKVMTEGRFRHMPVIENGQLAGLVSIGDVVKSRITELEVERDSLSRYITTTAT